MGNLALDVFYSLLALAIAAVTLYNAAQIGKEEDHEEETS